MLESLRAGIVNADYVKELASKPKMFVSSSIKTYGGGTTHTIQTDCFCIVNQFGDDVGSGTPYLRINGVRFTLQAAWDYSKGGGHQRMLFLPCKKGTVLSLENSTDWHDYGTIWTEIELVE